MATYALQHDKGHRPTGYPVGVVSHNLDSDEPLRSSLDHILRNFLVLLSRLTSLYVERLSGLVFSLGISSYKLLRSVLSFPYLLLIASASFVSQRLCQGCSLPSHSLLRAYKAYNLNNTHQVYLSRGYMLYKTIVVGILSKFSFNSHCIMVRRIAP